MNETATDSSGSYESGVRAQDAIRGRVIWREGYRDSELSYARYINGEERHASHIELDGIGYYPDDFQLDYETHNGVITGCVVDGIRFTRVWPHEEGCEVLD